MKTHFLKHIGVYSCMLMLTWGNLYSDPRIPIQHTQENVEQITLNGEPYILKTAVTLTKADTLKTPENLPTKIPVHQKIIAKDALPNSPSSPLPTDPITPPNQEIVNEPSLMQKIYQTVKPWILPVCGIGVAALGFFCIYKMYYAYALPSLDMPYNLPSAGSEPIGNMAAPKSIHEPIIPIPITNTLQHILPSTAPPLTEPLLSHISKPIRPAETLSALEIKDPMNISLPTCPADRLYSLVTKPINILPPIAHVPTTSPWKQMLSSISTMAICSLPFLNFFTPYIYEYIWGQPSDEDLPPSDEESDKEMSTEEEHSPSSEEYSDDSTPSPDPESSEGKNAEKTPVEEQKDDLSDNNSPSLEHSEEKQKEEPVEEDEEFSTFHNFLEMVATIPKTETQSSPEEDELVTTCDQILESETPSEYLDKLNTVLNNFLGAEIVDLQKINKSRRKNANIFTSLVKCFRAHNRKLSKKRHSN